MDCAPSRFRPQTSATSTSVQSVTNDHRTCIIRSGGSQLRPASCATVVACLLMQIFSLASLASAKEEFGLIAPEIPICENCVQNYNVPAFGQNLGQLGGEVESEYSLKDAISLGSTGSAPSNFVQTGLGYVDYDQSFDYGQGFQHNQGFNSGVELVSYDSQLSTQNDGQAISATAYGPDYSERRLPQLPSAPAYSNYQVIPHATQRPNYAQNYQTSTVSSGNIQPGLAQRKAAQAAQSGVRGHLGGGLGGAKYEGVGWSNHSAQNAISSCCYWGVRPTAQIGVSKGKDGFWYACVLYH